MILRALIALLIPLVSTLCCAQNGLVTCRSADILSSRGNHHYLPVPSSWYSELQVQIQGNINRTQAESIVTYSPSNSRLHWNKIDFEEITPSTWKWVSMEVDHQNGELSIVSLRRPVWWLKQHKLDSAGNAVHLNIEEFAIKGTATVRNVYASQIDTRFWDEERNGDFACQPIIGKFEHLSNNVFRLSLENKETILVTGNHPIWSHDRNRWVVADSLEAGEHITTRWGIAKLKSKEKIPGSHKVYNIEVYRSHNYFASASGILAHNGPCGIDFSSDYWGDLVFKSFSNVRFLTPRYIAYMATDVKGDDFNVVLYYIQSVNDSNPSGSFTKAMEQVIEDARKSGAKNINFMVGDVMNPKLKGYFSNFDEKFEGFTMNTDGRHFGFVGNLDEIKPRTPDDPNNTP